MYEVKIFWINRNAASEAILEFTEIMIMKLLANSSFETIIQNTIQQVMTKPKF